MRYDTKTIALHWTTAVLVLVLWVIGQTDDFIPKGAPHRAYWSLHFVLGFFLAAVLIARIVWRSTGGTKLPPVSGGVLNSIAQATHYLLYALLIAVVALGIANAFVHGVSIFGVVHLPQLGERSWKEPLTDLHGLAANVLLAVALFHAAAALAHHYVRRDQTLSRMLPGASTRAASGETAKIAVRQAR